MKYHKGFIYTGKRITKKTMLKRLYSALGVAICMGLIVGVSLIAHNALAANDAKTDLMLLANEDNLKINKAISDWQKSIRETNSVDIDELKTEPTWKADQNKSLLDRIAFCESGNDYFAQSSTSTAFGKYQIIDATWNEMAKITGKADKMNPEHQEINARELLARRGTRPWNASKSCWN